MIEIVVYAGLIAIPVNYVLTNYTDKNLPEWLIHIGEGYIEFLKAVFG